MSNWCHYVVKFSLSALFIWHSVAWQEFLITEFLKYFFRSIISTRTISNSNPKISFYDDKSKAFKNSSSNRQPTRVMQIIKHNRAWSVKLTLIIGNQFLIFYVYLILSTVSWKPSKITLKKNGWPDKKRIRFFRF